MGVIVNGQPHIRTGGAYEQSELEQQSHERHADQAAGEAESGREGSGPADQARSVVMHETPDPPNVQDNLEVPLIPPDEVPIVPPAPKPPRTPRPPAVKAAKKKAGKKR